MTHLQQILLILGAQKPDSYLSGNWDKLDTIVLPEGPDDAKKRVQIKSLDIIFVFDENGTLEGISNYKE